MKELVSDRGQREQGVTLPHLPLMPAQYDRAVLFGSNRGGGASPEGQTQPKIRCSVSTAGFKDANSVLQMPGQAPSTVLPSFAEFSAVVKAVL